MKHTKPIIVAALAVITLLSFAACDVVLGSLVSGRVVNVKSSVASGDYVKGGSNLTLEEAEITLTGLNNGDSFSTTVSSDGSYDIGGLTAGKYRITGEKDGWAFIPMEIFIGGSLLNIPDLYAYPIQDAGAVTVVLSWEETSYDVDLKATYGNQRNDDNTKIIHSEDYNSAPDGFANIETEGTEGSGPGYYLSLDRDVRQDTVNTQPRVETITITESGSPVPNSAEYFESSAGNELGHEIRFYADIYNEESDASLTGDDSNNPSYAQMHVMFGTAHYGTWTIPVNSAENTLHIVNVYVYDYTTNPNYQTGDGDTGFSVYTTGNYGDDYYRSIQE